MPEKRSYRLLDNGKSCYIMYKHFIYSSDKRIAGFATQKYTIKVGLITIMNPLPSTNNASRLGSGSS